VPGVVGFCAILLNHCEMKLVVDEPATVQRARYFIESAGLISA
jgi:hypothetical protein